MPHLKGAHLILNEIAAGLLRDAPVGALDCAVLLIVYDLVLVTTPWDINSMTTRSLAQRR